MLLGLGGGASNSGNGGGGELSGGAEAAAAAGRACASAEEGSVLRELQVALLAAARPATLVEQLLWAERQVGHVY